MEYRSGSFDSTCNSKEFVTQPIHNYVSLYLILKYYVTRLSLLKFDLDIKIFSDVTLTFLNRLRNELFSIGVPIWSLSSFFHFFSSADDVTFSEDTSELSISQNSVFVLLRRLIPHDIRHCPDETDSSVLILNSLTWPQHRLDTQHDRVLFV